LEGAGEVDGGGAFADAAFAAGDGDDAFDAGNFVLVGPGCGGRGGSSAGGVANFDMGAFDAGNRAKGLLDIGFQLGGDFGGGFGKFDRDADGAGVDGDLFDQSEGNDIARVAGIFDRFER